MMSDPLRASAAAAAFVLAAACVAGSPEPAGDVALAPASAEPAPEGALFHDDLRAIAAQYRGYGRLDDEGRWAPLLCRLPRTGEARESDADAGAHGRKLYTLYVQDPLAYAAVVPPAWEEPLVLDGWDQVIVKESWVPAPWDGDLQAWERWNRDESWGPSGLRPARRGGAFWKADELFALFVMARTNPAAPGTDEGWIYGIVSPEGEVRAAGRVDACIGCHASAPRGRLFGPPDLPDYVPLAAQAEGDR